VLEGYPITHNLLDDIFRAELSEEDYERFCETNDIDFAMTVRGARFRANGYHTLKGWALIMRTIVTEVPNIDQLGLPAAVQINCERKKRHGAGNRGHGLGQIDLFGRLDQ